MKIFCTRRPPGVISAALWLRITLKLRFLGDHPDKFMFATLSCI